MAKHIQKAIKQLQEALLEICATVEKSVSLATRSLEERNDDFAQAVIRGDARIDAREVELEEECLKVLALHQPVAGDLRFIVSALKINNDLERIGDLAVNIAERALYLNTCSPPLDLFNFGGMAAKVMDMLRRSVDSLVQMDTAMANEVCRDDDEIDEMNRHAYEIIEEQLRQGTQQAPIWTHLLSVARHLERIADHATNIAEDVIYMITGDIVRHTVEDYARAEVPAGPTGSAATS